MCDFWVPFYPSFRTTLQKIPVSRKSSLDQSYMFNELRAQWRIRELIIHMTELLIDSGSDEDYPN